MITKEDLSSRHLELLNYAKQPNSNYGSLPKSLYKNDVFNDENWNGGDAIIRQFTYELERQSYDGGYYAKEFDFGSKGIDMVASWNGFNDQNYVSINLSVFDQDNPDKGWYFEQYLITYYKSRGKTDGIYKHGKLLDFDEYVYLLNMIEASGFKFNLEM